MKPQPKYNFSTSVRRQVWEEEAVVAAFYEGIFDVTLNYTVSIMFVPEFSRNASHWPPVLPDNIDEISSEQEARLITAALSKYTVTPHATSAGQEEIFPRGWSDTAKSGVLFYVSSHEFVLYSSELACLADERPAVHDGWDMSEVEDLSVIKFLVSRVLISEHFSEHDLALLGRGR